MSSKNLKKSVNKTEDLPSFLLNLKGIPDDIDIPSRPKKNDNYLGPIFFGKCLQYHPPHSLVPLGSFHHMQIFVPTEENILKDVFLPKSVPEKKIFQSKTFHPVIRPKKVFDDPFPHKCPGVRKVFAPDNFLSEGLGKTKSIIEGETSREIPFCRFKKTWDLCNPQALVVQLEDILNVRTEGVVLIASTNGLLISQWVWPNGHCLCCCTHWTSELISKAAIEVVRLSDIREERRMLLSENERRAHAHFPKEFVTVRVIGPTIPESITITKLPTKRHIQYEIDPHLKSKAAKTSNKQADKGEENPMEVVASETEKEEEGSKESGLSLSVKEESSVEERADSDNIRQQSEEFEDENGSEKSQIIKDEEERKEEEGEGEGEASEEGEEEAKEQEKSQVFAVEEKEGILGDAEEDNHQETAKD